MRKYYFPFIISGLIIISFAFGRACDHHDNNVAMIRIDTLKLTQTIYKDRVKVKEFVRNKYVVLWKEVRFDSITPCEMKLLYADTVIRVDSSLIYSLRDVIRVDSTIILAQDSAINKLKKQVKRERNKKRLWQVLAGVGFGLNAVMH